MGARKQPTPPPTGQRKPPPPPAPPPPKRREMDGFDEMMELYRLFDPMRYEALKGLGNKRR